MSQYELPKYVESDLAKTKIKKPPRNRKKEIDIYFYESNVSVLEIIKPKITLPVQVKFIKSTKSQITTPLNFDIAKPKFANISDSVVWGNQINGIIYEEIKLNTTNYSFMTLEKATSKDIKQIKKYRIINYDPIFDNKNNFIYATFNAVPDSIKTMPSIESFNWSLVNEFQRDAKTKYIKVIFEPEAFLFNKTFEITIKPNKTSKRRTVGFKTFIDTKLAFMFIKIRNESPLLYDNLTLASPKTDNLNIPIEIDDETGYSHNFPSIEPDIRSTELSAKADGVNISGKRGPGFQHAVYRAIDTIDHFNEFGMFEKSHNTHPQAISIIHPYYIKWQQRTLKNNSLFFTGGFSIAKHLLDSPDKLEINKDFKKMSDLDETNPKDRKYYVVGKRFDLTKLFTGLNYKGQRSMGSSGYHIRDYDFKLNKHYPKYDLLNKHDRINNIIESEQGDKITVDIELNKEGIAPQLKIRSLLSDKIKIMQYDANHSLLYEGTFNASSAFIESELITKIDLI